MKFYRITFLFFIAFILTACNSSLDKETEIELPKIPDHFKTISIDSIVTFACPNEMLQVENLKLSGDYQFSNLIDVQYAVVQVDLKTEELNLKEFTEIKLDDLKRKMIDPNLNELEAFSLDKIKGYFTEIETDVYGWPDKLHYWISTVELEDKFVTVIVWTIVERVKDFGKDAEIITRSFRLKNID